MFLGDAPTGQNHTPQEGGAGSAESGDEAVLAETVAMTIDAGRLESGLETEDGSDLRVELLTVVSGHNDTAADLLAHAASMISQDPGHWPPQPGTLLPDVVQQMDADSERKITARNGLLVVPYVWDDGVPHVHEVTSGGASRHSKEGDTDVEFTHPGRLTIVAQLVMLTDEEAELAQTAGVAAVQERLVREGVNINNIWR
ncbi:suppressor of fused domain protein [Corynebacterium sp. c9Ua_112]|uniref:Suppressor of fused domain protein n=1 Tax=Corynebacterium macclintockiae TaxID=2913501 RepID=A0A9X3M8C6_9CORY|nr:suppressor of fused domain protein [Corynebacterium macclintockiae]